MYGLIVGIVSATMLVSGTVAPAQAAPTDEVVFADAGLKACVASKLGVPTTSAITQGQLASMSGALGCGNLVIADIAPLKYATGLTSLTLNNNRLVDVSPLTGLSGLTVLDLSSNPLNDVSPLAGLTGLTYLSLIATQVEDATPLGRLTNLTQLKVTGAQAVDLAPLKNLTNLTTLRWTSSRVADITSLSGLVNLTSLNLSSNQIADVSPLLGLTNLTSLELNNNKIYDVSALANLTKLTELRIYLNQIVDISPFANLSNLKILSLDNNQVQDVSPLVGLTNLTALYISGQRLVPAPAKQGVAVPLPVITNVDGSSVPVEIKTGAGSISAGKVTWTKLAGSELKWDTPVTVGSVRTVFSGVAGYYLVGDPTLSGTPTSGSVGKAYSYLFAVTGSPTPTVSVTEGSLPAGLTLTFGGKLYGTPTTPGTYTFRVEAKNTSGAVSAKHTVKITPAEVTPPNVQCGEPRKQAVFTDAPTNQKFYKEIDWMRCTKLSTGYADKTYRPKTELSREAMAAFMFRLQAPKNYEAPKVSPFSDVPTDHKFYKEIAWMKESKLTTGYADGGYHPKDNLSREAMAAFIYRLEAKTSTSFTAPKQSPFSDVPKNQKFYQEIAWMKHSKLSTGYSDGSYRPKDNLSREAMAAFIYRLVTDYRK
ncbi:hypothetical protein G7068_06815 [Leucobacter viscericola]|uniref:SLH domain-containing protein n=1 Tax=Leucobacter viscericola TaxID=2714935 RepID=A0A6G7XES0_9MICO|nr:leucine-rich repeat domain-containing protein [Leucobacter viscericola]QIK62939.1 hypothetical protein G7068_06815 [Leucobacter viscericola]